MSLAPNKAAIIGGGVIGGGWAARFLLNGWDVSIYDPDPAAQRKIGDVLANARRSLPSLYDKRLPDEGRLNFCDQLASAAENSRWIQESVPERLELKHSIFEQIQRYAPEDAVIGSSTSGFKPSQLRIGAHNPEQILVAHPFNPVYLLPLVELVVPENTLGGLASKARDILTSIGMQPLIIAKEIDAHIADRLLEAVWREALWLIKDGICTTEQLDDAIRFGFGLRWAQMGLFETYRIAGGEAGMKHFLEQFGPALAWEWTKLMDVPEFNDELVRTIVEQSNDQSSHLSIRELERLRDDNLVGIMRSLKRTDSAAGRVLNHHERKLTTPVSLDLPITVSRKIPQNWTDYNGHMNEVHYLEAASQATDSFLEMAGCDASYIATGSSYFTVENHIRYLAEMHAGDGLQITTQVLLGEGKKLHLFHRLLGENDKLTATVETLLLHMDLNSRKTSLPVPQLLEKLAKLSKKHNEFSLPDRVQKGFTND